MKNKKKFILFVVLYVIGYLYFCIYGGMNAGMKISDNPVLQSLFLFSNMPVGVINLSLYEFVWIVLSFFLILFMIWQTDLTGPKLNRTALLWQGLNLVFTCLSRGFVEILVSGVTTGFYMILSIIAFLVIIVGIALLMTYLIQKKNGALNSYDAYSDIMTEDEFERWQDKKNRRN